MTSTPHQRTSDLAHACGLAATLLFAPGDRPDRFERAASCGAGLVVLDLEDAVPGHAKVAAREAVAAWMAQHGPVGVRINPASSPHHDQDAELAARAGAAVMLPKVEEPGDIERLGRRLAPGQPVIALIESAAGVLNAAAISRTSPVVRLALGHFDLAVDLGVDPGDRDALLAVRSQLVLASRAAGLPGPVDGVTAALHDDAQLIDDVKYAQRLGMTGKLCIHPRQLAPVAAALRATPQELERAQRVVDAIESGVGVVDGRMVDAPVIARARQLLAQEANLPPT